MASLNKEQVDLLNIYIMGYEGYKLYLKMPGVLIESLEIEEINLKKILAGGLEFSTNRVSTDSIYIYEHQRKLPVRFDNGTINIAVVEGVNFIKVPEDKLFIGCCCYLHNNRSFGILIGAGTTPGTYLICSEVHGTYLSNEFMGLIPLDQ